MSDLEQRIRRAFKILFDDRDLPAFTRGFRFSLIPQSIQLPDHIVAIVFANLTELV